MPAVRNVLVAELDMQRVTYDDDWSERVSEWLVWWFTYRLRDRRTTPLTCYAGMLYELLDEEWIEDEDFDLTKYREVYAGVREYPGGEEIAGTFEVMATFLSSTTLGEVAVPDRGRMRFNQDMRLRQERAATRPQGWEPAGDMGGAGSSQEIDFIRPGVVTALRRLEAVRGEIATYQDSTSRANRLAALSRAADELEAIGEYVAAEVAPPERYILRRIVQQWQRLIIEAGGKVGRAAVAGPIPNPYILNNPAEGAGFVGREDTMRRLEELWAPTNRQIPSVVIYGHRRMGKTSILHNLGRRFGATTVIVDFNMQRVGRVRSNADLLYQLAVMMYDECERQGLVGLTEPQEAEFPDASSYLPFNRFLTRLDQVREGRRFIVTVDEFEKIEEQIITGQLTADLLDVWRGVFMTFPWFVMAFAGLHTLEELRRDYWHPLFGSVTALQVSFLTAGAARQLIIQPDPDFDLDYDEDAIECIIALTNGQPFLLQLIGHSLVTRFNQQTFEQGSERERRFHLADVEAVSNAPEFDRDGNAYFSGVWQQAERSNPGGQTDILRALAPHPAGRTLAELALATGLATAEVVAALGTLQAHDMVRQCGERYGYTVELMRRWVERNR